MAQPQRGRFMADLSGHDEVVVFIIGIRPNTLWKVRSWWPVFSAMPTMLRHLDAHPEQGLLGVHGCFSPWPMLIQYWRSFEDLERFSRDPTAPHLEPWRSFNRTARVSGDVGIWHETYRVRPSELETIYTNMPAVGLGKAVGCVPVRHGRDSAAARLGLRPDDGPSSSRN
jgi:hypothetical protein